MHALAPGVRRTVEQLGFQFDLSAIISAAKRDESSGFDTIKGANANAGNRARAIAYLQSAGLPFAEPGAAVMPAPATLTEPPYYSFKIFGSTAALCVSEARTRAGNQCTIQVEGALLLANGGSHKEFDWRNKLIVQLTVQEAYLALALFENLIPSVKFDGHGRTHEKSLHIDFQESHYFVRVIQRGRAAVAVPIRPVDAIPIVALLYSKRCGSTVFSTYPNLSMIEAEGTNRLCPQISSWTQSFNPSLTLQSAAAIATTRSASSAPSSNNR